MTSTFPRMDIPLVAARLMLSLWTERKASKRYLAESRDPERAKDEALRRLCETRETAATTATDP